MLVAGLQWIEERADASGMQRTRAALPAELTPIQRKAVPVVAVTGEPRVELVVEEDQAVLCLLSLTVAQMPLEMGKSQWVDAIPGLPWSGEAVSQLAVAVAGMKRGLLYPQMEPQGVARSERFLPGETLFSSEQEMQPETLMDMGEMTVSFQTVNASFGLCPTWIAL